MFEVQFTSVIRGHHIYKSVWTPTLGEKLNCREDNRKEAKQHDEYPIGTYLEAYTGSELVGYVPMELSYLIYTFLRAYDDNEVSAKVTGSRRLENGLFVPGTLCILFTLVLRLNANRNYKFPRIVDTKFPKLTDG